MAQIFLIHSSHDKSSRDLVNSVTWTNGQYIDGSGNAFCLVDWYGSETERFSRTCPCHTGQAHHGPPPSSFPEFHVQLGLDNLSFPVPMVQSFDLSGNLLGTIPAITIPANMYGFAKVSSPKSLSDALDQTKWTAYCVYGDRLGGQTPTEIIRQRKILPLLAFLAAGNLAADIAALKAAVAARIAAKSGQ